MPVNHGYSLALEKLDERIGRGWRLGLDGIRDTLSRLPPVNFPVVLVAGTNGKGAVCTAIDSILRDRGLTTGLTISPHLCDVRERIVVNGERITPEEFAEIYVELDQIDQSDATYFEMIALMAIRAFQIHRVDAAVVEIGMGGRLDAFNALDPAVSVITSIGLEHTAYLGDTIEKIAIEKAQIARQDRHVISGVRISELSDEFMMIGARPRYVEARDGELYHEHNERIAVQAAGVLFTDASLNKKGKEWSELCAVRAAGRSTCPCRFELLSGQPRILLDAAHNPPGAAALGLRIAASFPGSRLVALVAFLSDKDHAGFFAAMGTDLIGSWIVTEIEADRAMPAASVNAPVGAEIIADLRAAFDRATQLAGSDGIVIVTGSIYFLGECLARGLFSDRVSTGELRGK